MENSYHNLINYIEKQTTFRCQNYKEKPLKRRIRVRMRALGLADFSSYLDYLEEHPDEFDRLLDTLTINLSYIFRNPETFEYIKNDIFPLLDKQKDKFIFWSAGCAHGEEPYSLAIIAAESNLLSKVTIYATDIDTRALETAEKGIYPVITFQYAPQNIVAKYFEKTEEGFSIKRNIKQRVQFSNLDLFEIPPFRECDLIMCRNVLIYLDRSAQSLILKNFYDQLKPGGYLIIGKVELLIGIPEVKLFEVVSRAEHVYRKKEIPRVP